MCQLHGKGDCSNDLRDITPVGPKPPWRARFAASYFKVFSGFYTLTRPHVRLAIILLEFSHQTTPENLVFRSHCAAKLVNKDNLFFVTGFLEAHLLTLGL
jgi:hypothetical protein